GLEELGFGLDLARCAATGSAEDLAFVSPKSGRAVSRGAGAPWADRMLALPAFLRRGAGVRPDLAAMEDAFRLTAFFLARHVYEPRGLDAPEARAGLIAALPRRLSQREGEDAAGVKSSCSQAMSRGLAWAASPMPTSPNIPASSSCAAWWRASIPRPRSRRG